MVIRFVRGCLINSRHACAARITVVVVCVCVCVCLLIHIWPLERLFVLKMLSRTQRETKIKKFVGFSQKLLHCRDPAPASLYHTVIFHFHFGNYVRMRNVKRMCKNRLAKSSTVLYRILSVISCLWSHFSVLGQTWTVNIYTELGKYATLTNV